MKPFRCLATLCRLCAIIVPAALWTVCAASAAAEPISGTTLWYRQPAERWLAALPVGNGRLGAMVFGGVNTETLALNESTLWSGAPSDTNINPDGKQHLAEIRRLLFAGDYAQARALCAHLVGRKNSYGTHLPLADLSLKFQGSSGQIVDYRRALDLDEAVTTVEFTQGENPFHREVFASNPVLSERQTP